MNALFVLFALGLGAASAQQPSSLTDFTRCGDGECAPGTRCIEGKHCPKDSACAEFPFWCKPASGPVDSGNPPLRRDPWRPLAIKASPDERAKLAVIFKGLSEDQKQSLAELLASFGAGDGARLAPYLSGLSDYDKKLLTGMMQNFSPCGANECTGTANFEPPLCYGADAPIPSACERALSGACAWGPPRCRRGPETCEMKDCGPKPMHGWQCPDSTTRGFGYCIHQPDGRCGWQVNGCAADCGITLTGGEGDVSTFDCQGGTHPVCSPDHFWRCEHDACPTPADGQMPQCAAGLAPRWGATSCSWECLSADHCDGRCGPGEQCRVVSQSQSGGQFWGCVDARERLCREDACGARPGLPNWRCPDGSLGGPGACVLGAAGKCYWKIHFCSASKN